MRLHFERQLPCEPEVAWSLATEPAKINLWSRLPVRCLSLGDGGHVAGVGALRSILLPLGTAGSFEEVVVVSEPSQRCVSRVIPQGPIQAHESEMTIAPSGDGSLFGWRLEVMYVRRTGIAHAKRRLISAVEDSLDRMVDAAESAHGDDPPPSRSAVEPFVVRQCLREAEALQREQLELADDLADVSDPKGWIARWHGHLTERHIRAVRENFFEHPDWVLRALGESYRYYERAVQEYLRGRRSVLEAHWARTFREIDQVSRGHKMRLRAVGRTIALGFVAHTGEDVPRALTDVYFGHYADSYDFVRFRADYLAMGELFWLALRDLSAVVPHGSLRLGSWPSAASHELSERMIGISRERFFQHRLVGFERGQRLCDLIRSS